MALLWVISGLFADEWNPLALAMGTDNRLSTSKFQALLWTATVAFVYAMIYADRVSVYGLVSAITSVPDNVLIALGISATSAVAAKAITTSQVAANPGSKTPNSTPSYAASSLVMNDNAATPSLSKVQFLFWTVVAIVVYLVNAFHGLADAAICSGENTPCSLPNIDTVLMLFMGLGSATYAGVKLTSASVTPTQNSSSPSPESANSAQPASAVPSLNAVLAQTVSSVTSAVAILNADGSQTVSLVGVKLGTSGVVLMNGSPITPAALAWADSLVTFTMPKKPAGGQWSNADGVSFALSVNGATLGPVPCTY